MPNFLTIFASPLIITSILVAVFYGCVYVLRDQSFWRSILKTLPVSILALHVFVVAGPILLGIALALCALGDAFLSWKGERNFLAGLVSFLFAHLLFALLFVRQFTQFENFTVSIYLAWVIFAVAGFVAGKILSKRVGNLLVPVLIYIVVIIAMAWTGFASEYSSMVKLGIVLFAISDFVLSLETFVLEEGARKKTANLIVWFTYYFGQLFIVAGVLSGIIF